jgi:hypothetical protein
MRQEHRISHGRSSPPCGRVLGRFRGNSRGQIPTRSGCRWFRPGGPVGDRLPALAFPGRVARLTIHYRSGIKASCRETVELTGLSSDQRRHRHKRRAGSRSADCASADVELLAHGRALANGITRSRVRVVERGVEAGTALYSRRRPQKNPRSGWSRPGVRHQEKLPNAHS